MAKKSKKLRKDESSSESASSVQQKRRTKKRKADSDEEARGRKNRRKKSADKEKEKQTKKGREKTKKGKQKTTRPKGRQRSSSSSSSEAASAAKSSGTQQKETAQDSDSSSEAAPAKLETPAAKSVATKEKAPAAKATGPQRPKKRTKAERITMVLEDRLSATARYIATLERRVAEERASAEAANANVSKVLHSLETTRAKLKQFASAATNIKKNAAQRVEKRDTRIAQLQAAASHHDAQINSLASSREALLSALAEYKKHVGALSARLLSHGEEDLQKSWVEPKLDPADMDLTGSESLPHRRLPVGPSALRMKRPADDESHRNGGASNGGTEETKAAAGNAAVSFAEGEALSSILEVTNFKSAGAAVWILHPGRKVQCDQCDKRVPTMTGFLLSDSNRSQFMQERFLCGDCGEEVLNAEGGVAGAAVAKAAVASETPRTHSTQGTTNDNEDDTEALSAAVSATEPGAASDAGAA